MKGAKALPWAKIINPPNASRTSSKGSNQSFFLTFKNLSNSDKKDTIFLLLFY